MVSVCSLHDSEVTEVKRRSLYPKKHQWTLLILMIDALKPLQVATTALCEAEIVSVSLVYLIICSLVTKHIVVQVEDSPGVT